MPRSLLLCFAILGSATTAGCASSQAYESASAWNGDGFDSRAAPEKAEQDEGGGGGPAPLSLFSPAPPAPAEAPAQKPMEAAKRLIIYTGSLSLMVPEADVAIAAFVEQVVAGGGYLQMRASTTVTVRVPAADFFATLERLRKSGTVTNEQINAADVTKKVFDLELRLHTADEARKRLLKILESATKIEDILAIEVQVRRLTDEIELMKGELRNLGDQIAFSTLTVSFLAHAPAPRAYPERTRSRFEWVNQVGVEQVLNGF